MSGIGGANQFGMGVQEGKILGWLKDVGDRSLAGSKAAVRL
jgi:hypothetical protein